MDEETEKLIAKWSEYSPDYVISLISGDVRTYITSVKGWAMIISKMPETASIEVFGFGTLAEAMQSLSERADLLLDELLIAGEYVRIYREKRLASENNSNNSAE
jgi:hypothetical protein